MKISELLDVNISRLGDVTETLATAWLMEQGFEVFKNAGCTGPVDLIAMDRDGKIILIDVKSFIREENKPNLRYKNARTDHQKDLGVQVLGYDRDKGEFRYVKHRDETTYTRYRDESAAQQSLDLCDPGC